ncbi:putative ribonuclease H-like domain-containing protein [Tanacetum coccineum]
MRGRPGVFVGYPHGTKGYKIYDPSHNKIIVSRDVKFPENAFPFGTNVKEKIGENDDEIPYDVGEEQVETSHEPTDEEWSNHDVPDPSNDEDRQSTKETNDDTED